MNKSIIKILSGILTVILIISSCAFSVSAENPEETIETKTINNIFHLKKGDVVEIATYAKYDKALVCSYNTKITADSSVLGFKTQTVDKEIKNAITNAKVKDNKLYVAASLMSANDIFDFSNGVMMAKTSFVALNDCTTSIESSVEEIYVTIYIDNMTQSLLSVINDTDFSTHFTINGCELGDTNQSGDVSVADAIMIQKHIARIESLKDTALTLGDMDGNNEISVSDAIMVQKIIAGI